MSIKKHRNYHHNITLVSTKWNDIFYLLYPVNGELSKQNKRRILNICCNFEEMSQRGQLSPQAESFERGETYLHHNIIL